MRRLDYLDGRDFIDEVLPYISHLVSPLANMVVTTKGQYEQTNKNKEETLRQIGCGFFDEEKKHETITRIYIIMYGIFRLATSVFWR